MQRIINIKPGEWALALSLIFILATNTLVFEVAEVVATTGFVSNVGTPQIILLWLVSLPITLAVAAVYSLIVDRVKRRWLMSVIMLLFAALYLAALGIFVADAPDEVKFPFLYLLTELQYAVFPLAFWALASDLYTTSQTKRLFPILATGGAIGSILGNGMAAALTEILPEGQSDAPQVLMTGAVVFLLGFLLLRGSIGRQEIRARQSTRETTIKKSFIEGWEVVRDVPMFRWLMVAMFAVGLGFLIIEFHFLYSLDQAANESDNSADFFQAFYGIYKALLIGGTLIFQSVISSRYLEKTGLKNSFMVLPFAMIGGLLVIGVYSTAVGVGLGRLIMRVFQRGWDEPSRKSALALVPDERRGRVSTIMENYFYTVASILGSLIVGVLLLLSEQFDVITRDQATIGYLSVVGVGAMVAIYATYKIRGVYEESLLNWRLSRSRRKSVLDGIEF